MTVFPVADSTERASAEVNGDEYSLAVGMSSEVNISINPTYEGALNIAKSTITSSTNAPTGYKLYIASTDENNSILLEGEEKYSVKYDAQMVATSGTFITPEALYSSETTPATWGYAVASLNNFDDSYDTTNPSATSKFAAVPTAGNGQLIHETDAAIENDAVDVYYGTKVNPVLRHGKYKTWIKYVAITDMVSEIVEGVSIFPRRIRNNYEAGTTITISSETNIASDLGLLKATVNNEVCSNVKKISDSPLVITCEIPADLENGEYDVSLEIPQYGKTFTSATRLHIVDPYDSMQGIDREVYDSVLTEQQYQFYDERDDKKYYVTKLSNGDLVMTQNLDFEISSEGTTLSPDTTDVTSEKTITKTNATHNNLSQTARYSYTSNFQQDGTYDGPILAQWQNNLIRGTGRDEESSQAHVVTIPGATSLSVELYFNTDGYSWGALGVWEGAHPGYSPYGSSASSALRVYQSGGYNTIELNGVFITRLSKYEFTVPGDTITFAIESSYTNNSDFSKGYYAIIRGIGDAFESEDLTNPASFFQIHVDADESIEDLHLAPGSLYSISTAYTTAITESLEQTESICPKGWHLDNYGSFIDTNISMYANMSGGNGTIATGIAPLFYDEGGFIGENFASINIYNSAINTKVSNASSIYNNILNGDNPAYSVRCVFRAPQYFSLSFDTNGGSYPPEDLSYGGWEEGDTHIFKIGKNVPTREGSTFIGWGDSSSAIVASYQPGDTFVATGQHTLYAIWDNTHNYFDDAFEAAGKTKVNGYYAMQDMTNDICAAVPSLISEFEAHTTQLIDTRDNKIYFVSKLQDGKCWMTQNLNFELSGTTTLDPSTSSVSVPRTISATAFNENAVYYQSHGNDMQNDYYGVVDITTIATSLQDPVIHYLVGSSYTYPAATALAGKTNAVYTSSSNSEVITNQSYQGDEPDLPDVYAEVEEGYGVPIVKYSHTQNIDDTGYKNSNYGNSWGNSQIRGTGRTSASSEAHVINIPGASTISVDIYYNGESTSWDWVSVWQGSHPTYTASANSSSTGVIASKLGGSCSGSYTVNGNTLTNICYKHYDIAGDTVTFSFRSDGSGVGLGYGYYAIVSNGISAKYADEPAQDYIPPKEEPTANKQVAYSRTQNIDESGRKNTDYLSGWGNNNIIGTGKGNNSNAHVISMSNVDYMTVDVYYAMSCSSDYVSVYAGSHSDYTYSNNGYAIYGAKQLYGWEGSTQIINGNSVPNVMHKRVLVPGRYVTFTFHSECSGSGNSGYGYYAIVTGAKLPDSNHQKIGTKYSYTQNLDQNGHKQTDYGENWGNENIVGSTRGGTEGAHVVTIPGASRLLVDIYYNTESTEGDWATVWSGSRSSATAKTGWADSLSGKLGGPQYGNYVLNGAEIHDMGHAQYVILGNTVTFSFTSDGALAGSGYGYYAIVTGYGTSTSSYVKQSVVQESICPKGWRLPHVLNSNNNEFSKLLPEGNYTAAARRRYFTNQPLYYTDTDAPTAYINDNSIESLAETLNNIYSHDDDTLGLVRCVAEDTYAFSMTFDANGGNEAPENIYVLFTDNETKSFMIPDQDISYPGFKFLGWSQDQNASTASYMPGNYYTFDTSEVHLYAIWQQISTFEDAFAMAGKTKVDGTHYAMQDLTDEICGWLPDITGDAITSSLVDVRDGKTYNVAKLRDNHCWMVQDLALDFGENGLNLNSGTSDVRYTDVANGTTVKNENGTFYTYKSATNNFGRGLKSNTLENQFTPSGAPADSYGSICPKSWHLPNEFGNYSFEKLLEAYDYAHSGNLVMTGGDWVAFNAAFRPNLAGSWNTGSGDAVANTTVSGYWTSMLAGNANDAVIMKLENNVASIAAESRNTAMGVRCVAGNASKSTPILLNLATMQGITPELINTSGNGMTVSGVLDERDSGKAEIPSYTIAKMPDGKLWMISSLRYEHVNGDILDPYTSDVSGEIAFSGETASSYYIATPSSVYFEDNGGTLSEREEGTYDKDTIGYYYSYDYATVNNTADSSICPAGWTLPDANTFSNLMSSFNYYTGNYSIINNTLLNMQRGGYYSGVETDLSEYQGMGENGLYWASNRISNRNARALWFNATTLNTAYPQARNTALQVRCVSR